MFQLKQSNHNTCLKPPKGFLFHADGRRPPLKGSPFQRRTGKPRRNVQENGWKGLQKMFSYNKRLMVPLQRGLNYLNQLIPIVCDIDVEEDLEYRI